jgi:hypothetical protein
VNKALQPPFVPDVRSCLMHQFNRYDVSSQPKKPNFDASHELEELLLEDNPLKAKHRKQNVDNMTPEMRQMEEGYVLSFLSSCSMLVIYK